MSLYFWIFIGSGLGGLARFALSGQVAHRLGHLCVTWLNPMRSS